MLERQREGIAAAKAEGKYKGRAPTARAKTAEIRRLRAGWASGSDPSTGCWRRPQRRDDLGAGAGIKRPARLGGSGQHRVDADRQREAREVGSRVPERLARKQGFGLQFRGVRVQDC
jgi:hypothetical protein